MNVVVFGILAVLLVGHGLIHLWWVKAPDDAMAQQLAPEKAWPARWGVPVGLVRALTLALAFVVFALYAASAIGLMGWLLGPAAWKWTTIAASALSLALLAMYLHPSEWVGITLDVALLALLLADVPARFGIPRGV